MLSTLRQAKLGELGWGLHRHVRCCSWSTAPVYFTPARPLARLAAGVYISFSSPCLRSRRWRTRKPAARAASLSSSSPAAGYIIGDGHRTGGLASRKLYVVFIWAFLSPVLSNLYIARRSQFDRFNCLIGVKQLVYLFISASRQLFAVNNECTPHANTTSIIFFKRSHS
jgi:hypothetical protein